MTFLRYLSVQLVAYAIDIGVFFLLFAPGLAAPALANVTGKIAAGLFAFFAHRHFTFRLGGRPGRAIEAVRYFALLAVNAPVSSLILLGFLAFIANVTAAKVASDVVAVGLTFALTRWLVFPRAGARAAKAARDSLPAGDP